MLEFVVVFGVVAGCMTIAGFTARWLYGKVVGMDAILHSPPPRVFLSPR